MEIDFKNLNIKNLQPQNEFDQQVVEFLKFWFFDSRKVTVKTSGSTGIPKIFEIEKDNMLISAKKTCDFLALKEGNSALLCLPVEYISGKMMIARAIERKLNLLVTTPSLQPLENQKKEIDFCAMTPLQVENSLEKIHLIKNLIIGGASVSVHLKKLITNQLSALNAQCSTKIYETFGMSETLSHIGLKQIYPIDEEFFTVLEGVKISVDERNCLRIFAPEIHAEILQTNDLVELINDKQFKFIGRLDNIINSGGVKISPESLETILKKEIQNEVVFLGIPDETFGQKLVLIIEGEDSEIIRNEISKISFPKKHDYPKEIFFIEKFPRTPNGKILRKDLQEIIIKNI